MKSLPKDERNGSRAFKEPKEQKTATSNHLTVPSVQSLPGSSWAGSRATRLKVHNGHTLKGARLVSVPVGEIGRDEIRSIVSRKPCHFPYIRTCTVYEVWLEG